MLGSHVTFVPNSASPTGKYYATCTCNWASIAFGLRADAVKAGTAHRANMKVQAL